MGFSRLIWIFSVCHFVYTYSSWSDPWSYLHTPCACVLADFFLSVVDFFLSFTSEHLCITPVCSEQLMCYVLLVIKFLRMNGFFSSSLWIFSCVSWSTLCSSLSDPWCYLQTPFVSDFFLSVTDFFLSFAPVYFCISPVCSE